MIPLRIRIEGAKGEAPFVLRLQEPDATLTTGPWDATFAGSEGGGILYESRQGQLRLSGVPAADLVGDVLLVDPKRQVAHRLIRASSDHNTFLVTKRCDQLCVMCSQPPKAHHVDLFPLFLQAVLLAPRGMTIGITGGEPTLYKHELFELLGRALAARPDLRFHVLTNGQHFTAEDVSALAALPRQKVLWGIPLYACEPALHDEIVVKPGAFERLTHSLALLARCGAAIELRTVVMANNVAALKALATFVTTKVPFVAVWALMQLENIGYGRMNWGRLFFDTGKCFAPIAAAIDTARARGIAVALYNFPLCTVPSPYRPYARASISDWKRRYLDPCDGCRLRENCGGFFEWYPDGRGFSAVGLA